MVDWSRYQLVSSPCAHLTCAIDYPDVHLYCCVPHEQQTARRAQLLTNNTTAAHLSYAVSGRTRMEIMSAVSVEI